MLRAFLLCSALVTGTGYAQSNVYFGADYLSNDANYALQYGFYFDANPELDFGYELEYAKYSQQVHSFGINIKPAFRQQNFYLAPIGGAHYFSDDVDFGFIYGVEVGYITGPITLRAGYKESSEAFKYNDNLYLGAALVF